MRHPPTPSQRCRCALFACAAGLFLSTSCLLAQTEKAVALGDSLTAEYEDFDSVLTDIGYPVREFDHEPTAYARVDDALRVSRSWVEVLGRQRGFYFDFGQWRPLKKPWAPPRLSGYERNWAVPGATAAVYEEFFTTSFNSNPLFYGFRVPLDGQIRTGTKRVVVWLGTNDLRAKYGAIAKAYLPATRDGIVNPLKAGLIDDLRRIIQRIKMLNSKIEIVVVNLPDLGAAPKIKAEFIDHADDPQVPNEPNPSDPSAPYETVVQKSFVTAATESINTAIAALATEEEVALADVYSITKSLIADTPFYYGAIKFNNDAAENNDQHSLFTRDEFHPNTALQIQIARAIVKAFNLEYDTLIPQITQAEALKALKIRPREPYELWIAQIENMVSAPADRALLKDPDTDGMTNLMEYTFNTVPGHSNAGDFPFSVHGPVSGISGDKSVKYRAAPSRPEIDIAVQRKVGKKWLRVPDDHVIKNADGTARVVIPPSEEINPPFRIKVTMIPPQGSLNTISTVYRLDKFPITEDEE